ncbi:type I-F CRISPR-associated endoribonuclease Cas6/Csy4 [Variovorax terrae]|uniref:Type I-F CRISPR-associated endoribonuclease Cas6/Csy4 n=1 Tax=Variovorax terrae TaxID=2923278 RepID=A0A9X1VQ99_9BURK|nr:type I-F CRISPR-associated endoribonuclease Cas6/Csy4 [Variovorax terrae]MCJ0761816.1 type I-F CRISPR-associated endoribonuclease Cas6/Csy4 [Variovorax terrae]
MALSHYLDITLRPDPEFSPAHLLNALYAKLHRALVHLGTGDIGVSFPQLPPQGQHLGRVLRLHGSPEALQRLQALPWLQGMHDHLQWSEATPVPPHAQHRSVSRVQAKSSPDRLRRRQMKRKGLTEAQALAQVPDSARETLTLPYLDVHSSSTRQRFRLFVRHGPLQAHAVDGLFSAYGFSPNATVPWF